MGSSEPEICDRRSLVQCKHDNWKTVLPFGFKLTELMNIDKTQVKLENQHDWAIFFRSYGVFYFFTDAFMQ